MIHRTAPFSMTQNDHSFQANIILVVLHVDIYRQCVLQLKSDICCFNCV